MGTLRKIGSAADSVEAVAVALGNQMDRVYPVLLTIAVALLAILVVAVLR